MKDNRFITLHSDKDETLYLSQFSNFHKSGSIQGMRNLYYGKDALLLQKGDFIYHVDAKTFQAAKDLKFLNDLPQWVQNAVRDNNPLLDNGYDRCPDEQTRVTH